MNQKEQVVGLACRKDEVMMALVQLVLFLQSGLFNPVLRSYAPSSFEFATLNVNSLLVSFHFTYGTKALFVK